MLLAAQAAKRFEGFSKLGASCRRVVLNKADYSRWVRWTPHPVIVTIRDNKDYIRVLLYSSYTTITGWGLLLIDGVHIGVHYVTICTCETLIRILSILWEGFVGLFALVSQCLAAHSLSPSCPNGFEFCFWVEGFGFRSLGCRVLCSGHICARGLGCQRSIFCIPAIWRLTAKERRHLGPWRFRFF